jgi:hypothetical protein
MPSFRALPRLRTDEVSDVLQVARVRILRYLARRGVVRLQPEALEIDDELAALKRSTEFLQVPSRWKRSRISATQRSC